LPSWSTTGFRVEAKVKDKTGNVFTYQSEESLESVHWAPMIILMPFKSYFVVARDVRRNLWNSMILRMQKDGILSSAKIFGNDNRRDLLVCEKDIDNAPR